MIQKIMIMILKYSNTFNTNLTGIGTQSIGFVNLSGINTTVSTASTSEIISTNIDNTDAFFASIEVNDVTSEETNFVELYLTHDGTSYIHIRIFFRYRKWFLYLIS